MSARDEAVEMVRRICPAHLNADEYGRFLAEKFDAFRNEVRTEVLGTGNNPSPLVMDAEAYGRLRSAIEATMTDPSEWDGDADEETLLARYVEWLAEQAATVRAASIPPLYVADYDSAPLTLHLTREAARAACDDVAKVDAHGRCWDWRAEEDGVDRQVWTHPDDDRPVSYTGGAVWEITVEGGAR